MLILTRRTGETIIIETPAGERIEVTVLAVKGNQVRIGTQGTGRRAYHAGRTAEAGTDWLIWHRLALSLPLIHE